MSCPTLHKALAWPTIRRFFGAIIFLCLFQFLLRPAIAGWKLIAQFRDQVNSSFFFDEQRGFLGTDNIEGIYRTSDGGNTWTRCQTPPPFIDSNFVGGYISDIFMKDSLNGWAGIESQSSG